MEEESTAMAAKPTSAEEPTPPAPTPMECEPASVAIDASDADDAGGAAVLQEDIEMLSTQPADVGDAAQQSFGEIEKLIDDAAKPLDEQAAAAVDVIKIVLADAPSEASQSTIEDAKEEEVKEPVAAEEAKPASPAPPEDVEMQLIEEIDPSTKGEGVDDSLDLLAADPLIKADEEQEGDAGRPSTQVIATPAAGGEAVASDDAPPMLSVKAPGALLESSFIDVAHEDSVLNESLDFDPIANDAQATDAECGTEATTPTSDLFNGKEAETILAEDVQEVHEHAETSAATDAPSDTTSEKYAVIHATTSTPTACAMCAREEVPVYLAHKEDSSLSICNAACLEKFKEAHADQYVERILRLREFAIADAPHEPEEAPLDDRDEGSAEGRDPFRLCRRCKRHIDSDDYLSWEALDFCNEGCLSDYQTCINATCAKCDLLVPENLLGKYCVRFGMTVTQFCKTTCLISYKKTKLMCQYCQADLQRAGEMHCSQRCRDAARPDGGQLKETSLCSVCGEVKEVELKVRDAAKSDSICAAARCFVAYKFVNNVELVKCEVCPTTFERKPGDETVYEQAGVAHILCSKECQKMWLVARRIIVNCQICLVKKYDFDMIRHFSGTEMTCVCSLNCLSILFESEYTQKCRKVASNLRHLEVIARENELRYDGRWVHDMVEKYLNAGKLSVQRIMATRPRLVARQRNKMTQCRPTAETKAIQTHARVRSRGVQTDDTCTRWVPIPVPIFVPMPLHMRVEAAPCLTPIPLPMLVPIFILTGRRTLKGIQKEITKIRGRIPADPLEAEILMMADMAAGDKHTDPASESDDDTHTAAAVVVAEKMLDTSIAMDTSAPTFNDDMLSMAFKMTNEYTEPLDLESEVDNSSRLLAASGGRRAYKPRGGGGAGGRGARVMEMAKPDENLTLKYTFGVNAWKQWATMKNVELQKLKNAKFIKLDLLQLPAEDLCYCLCQFIKEVRKPNGQQYASDTIYYLCLGIQLYLYENGRIDNLFCDAYYEKFTDTFNELCLAFCQLYNDNQYIVTRVEEEHLWESKQLGAHSPLVLLNTLLFFNTKHFNLVTVDDHLQLSFSHIMKHWKRNVNAPNQRNVLLRFYPPSKGAWGKRKVYEQQECLDNPLRCPVRLYEFFLSKCPESVKTRNDVFYLQPERSCVPDSPVWYSTLALDSAQLEKMLNRMKMIKEISMTILGNV